MFIDSMVNQNKSNKCKWSAKNFCFMPTIYKKKAADPHVWKAGTFFFQQYINIDHVKFIDNSFIFQFDGQVMKHLNLKHKTALITQE